MDFATFEAAALARGALLRTQSTLRSSVQVVADTRVDQPLAQPCVVQPILDALSTMGGSGDVSWRVERLADGTKRIHAAQPVAQTYARQGWDALAVA